MSEEQKSHEDEVFDQEVSIDDLDAAGGTVFLTPDDDKNNCVRADYRDIYGGKGFPNCAATVEEGSHCGTNDACIADAINYTGFKSTGYFDRCLKAWR